LLKHGYRNAIAIEGTSIPKTIVELSRKKKAIAFVDGDRAGELILRELVQVADIDFIARAPPGKEVEELTAKEIAKCLSNTIPADQYIAQLEKARAKIKLIHVPEKVVSKIKELTGTLKAVLYNENWEEISELPVRELIEKLQKLEEKVQAIVFDGVITQRLVDIANEKNIRIIIGARVGHLTKRPLGITLATFNELQQ